MGNVLCSLPPSSLEDRRKDAGPCLFNKTTFHSCSWEPTGHGDNSKADMLPVHREEPERKTLIGYKDVAGALVEQVEELMRRDKARNCSSSITTHGSTEEEDNVSSSLVGSVKSKACSVDRRLARNSSNTSNLSRTVVTTVSTATRKARNAPGGNEKEPSKKKEISLLAGWSEYEEAEALRQLIYNEIIATSGRNNTKRRMLLLDMYCINCPGFNMMPAAATTTAPRQSIPSTTTLHLHEDPRAMQKRQAIHDHGAVLHLRLRCKFVHYYKIHFARRQPHHPLTRAIEEGIETTHLTPSSMSSSSRRQARSRQPSSLPMLIHVSTEDSGSGAGSASTSSSTSSSSSAASSRLDFGAGPPSTPVRMLVTDTVFLDMALSGSLGLASRKRRPRAAYIDQSILQSPDEFVVLMNRRSGVPLAVCTLRSSAESSAGNSLRKNNNLNDSALPKAAAAAAAVVRMYATKRRFPGQLPVATTEHAGLTWSESLPLYAWAEFVATTSSSSTVSVQCATATPQQSQQQYWIYMVSDDSNGLTTFDASPSYCATHTGSTDDAGGGTGGMSPVWTITGRTWREWRHSDCAVLSLCRAAGRSDSVNDRDRRLVDTGAIGTAGTGNNKHKSDLFMKLSLSRGIDPALMICFSSFIDECMEKTMRLECSSPR